MLHQTSHTSQNTTAAIGNKEVDSYVRRVRAVTKESQKDLLEKLHIELKHPTTKYLALYCHALGLNIQNLKSEYYKIKVNCPNCRKAIDSRFNDYGSIKTDHENDEISMDFAGPIRPQTKKKNCYFLLITDNASEYTQIFPCKQATEEVVIESLQQWFKFRGVPNRVRADGAFNLSGRKVEQFIKDSGAKLIKSVKYQPSSNGIAERRIKEIKNYFCKNSDLPWDEQLIDCLKFVNYRVPVPEKEENPPRNRAKIKVGDIVYIQKRVRGHRFKENLGTEDKVKSIPSNTTVELEANGIWSLRDIIKKPE